MDPVLLIMAIRGALRAARVGKDAFEQYARDRNVLLPGVDVLPGSVKDSLSNYYNDKYPSLPADLPAALQPHWVIFHSGKPPEKYAAAVAELLAEKIRQQAANDATHTIRTDLVRESAGYWSIEQYRKDVRPVGPFTKIALTLFDISMEVAAYKPGLLGIGGNGEPLVKAVAQYVQEMIPNDTGALTAEHLSIEWYAGLFLRGGLIALSQHPNAVLEEAHLQQLTKNIVDTLIKKLPENSFANLAKRDVVEGLLTAIANSAVSTVAQNPVAFLGNDFRTMKPLGATTQAFLIKVADLGIENFNGKAGATLLYQSVTELIAAKPELFLGTPDTEVEVFLAAIVSDLVKGKGAGATKTFGETFGKDALLQMVCAAIESAKNNSSLVLQPGKPWQNILSQSLSPIAEALQTSILTGNTGAFQQFSRGEGLVSLTRIFLDQLSKRPDMLISDDKAEVKRLVGAVAGAMAADTNLLLSKDDWLQIAAVAAAEAAKNPDRLFGLSLKNDDGTPQPIAVVATPIIEGLLLVAAAQWKQPGTAMRKPGTVLFGETLRDAITITLQATAGNAKAALTKKDAIQTLALTLCDVVATNPERLGSREWLALYRILLPEILSKGTTEQLTADYLETKLKEQKK